MSRRGGGRASEPRRDQPSPAAPRGGGGRGRGRGRGAPAPTESAPAPTQPPPQRASPAPSPAAAQSQPPPPQRTAPATQEAASSSATPKAESLAGEMSKLTVSEASPPAPPPSSTRSVRFPARPGYGRAGTNCLVLANHFLVQVGATDLCHYDVTISPEITSKAINREIVKLMSKTFCESHLGSKKIAYDGMKSVYTAGELPFSSKEFAVKLPDKDGQGGSSKSQTKKRGGDREFKVVIKFASKPDIHHLAEFLRGRQRDIPQETIQALDVVLRQAPSEKYTVVGRSLFDVSLGGKGELGNGLEFWKGYYQSLRPTQMGLSLNIDVSARAFYEAIPLVDYLAKYLNLRTPSKPWTDQERLKVRKALKGIRVASQHLGHTKTYKVSGISVEPLNKLMFSLDEGGQKISVAQYFKQKYKIPIMYGSWPAIQAGSAAKPVSIPIEVCKIVSGQRYSRKLNEVQVRNLLRATCQRPVQRAESINTIVKSNKYNDVEVIRQFGLHIKEELTPVEARVLPPPTIMYHGTGRTATESPRLGQWNMIDKKMINGGKVDYWGCVNFSGWGDDSCYLFCEDLISMCSSRGMVFKLDPLIPIYSSTPTEIENTLVRIHRESSSKILQMSGQKDRPLQLLIVLLPEISGFYGKIKKVCETELGIVTQCCQTKKAEKGGKQYLENLSLKINVKVGGRNSVLQDAVKRNIPFVTDVPTIIFGADVTHPQPGEDSSPSIAAVVASMDWPEVSKYRGLVMAQTHRQELIEDLYTSTVDSNKGVAHGGMIRDHLLAFFRSTNQKPKRIIFYRDGVSEGQFSQVLLHEMDAIRKACSSLQGDYLPPVTFVVVQKRHHTRLFPYDSRKHGSTDRSGNILPGTVVDTKICHPSEFDFYLNSHAGIQGTSRPAHYHVLYDENKFSADALQVLTNNLCYTYARCTRSVSIVPPAYYAHLAAFRARYYIEGDASDAGSSSGGAGGPQRIQTLPVIKDCVKEVMFYC